MPYNNNNMLTHFCFFVKNNVPMTITDDDDKS